MTDENKTVPAETGLATQEQTSQADNSQQGAPEENAQATPQYVTPDQLESFGKELASRLKQSDRDRTKRIEGEIAGLKGLLQKTGVQIQPEQEAKLREEISERLDQFGDSPSQPAGEQPDADQLIAEFVTDVFSTAGTQVTQTDPEWVELQKVIDDTWNDPKGHIKVTAAAVKASEKKALRLASNQEGAEARVVGGSGPVGGVSTAASAADLWKDAYKK